MQDVPSFALLALAAWSLAACGQPTPPPVAIGAEASVPVPPTPEAEAPRKNVLLIVVDTLRTDHLSCYGYERQTSPNIDRLAQTGVRYERASSQAPWTTASIGALMTSRYPSELGIESDRSVLHDDQVLLAEILRAAGYRTAAAISHTFCSAQWGFDQGFESFDESNVLGHQKLSSPGVGARGVELLEELQDEPFFIWLHFFDPHFAYNNHSEFPFGDQSEYEGPVVDGMQFSKLTKLAGRLNARDMQQIRSYYDSEIRFTDEHIGRVLDKLEELGLADNTLVVFTADHGEEFLDHNRLGHAKTLYREVINVPLIIRDPGQPAGVVNESVALVDVVPTILSKLGVQNSHELRGQPLGARDAATPVFMENARGRPTRGVVADGYKLVARIREKTFELYDLSADPNEQDNVAALQPARVKEMSAVLSTWAQAMEAVRQAEQTELSPELQESLNAMGYGGSDDE